MDVLNTWYQSILHWLEGLNPWEHSHTWIAAGKVIFKIFLSGLVVGWLVHQAKKPAERSTGGSVMKPTRGVWIFSWGSVLFWAGLFIWAWLAPGNTKHIEIPLSIFLIFLMMSVYMLFYCFVGDVVWHEGRIEGPNRWGQRTTMAWESITEAKFRRYMHVVELKNKVGQIIWVSPYWQGFHHFLDILQRKQPTANIPWETLKSGEFH